MNSDMFVWMHGAEISCGLCALVPFISPQHEKSGQQVVFSQ
jgi:hypothetical protein